MNVLLPAEILTILVGVEHLGIMALEMFASPAKQAAAFGLPEAYTKQKEARVAMANQGIYNGMLGLLLVATNWLFDFPDRLQVWALLLLFVVVVAFYGGLTVGKKVWLMQMLPALLAEVLVVAVLI